MSDFGESPEFRHGHPEFSERVLTDAELDLLADDIRLTAQLWFGPYLSPVYPDCAVTIDGEHGDEIMLRANNEDYEGGVIQVEITSGTGEFVGDGSGSEIAEIQEFTMYANGFIEFTSKNGLIAKNGDFITFPKVSEQLGIDVPKHGEGKNMRKLARSLQKNTKLTTSHQQLLIYGLKVLQDYEINQSQGY